MRPLLLTLLLIGCSQAVEPPLPPSSACEDDRFEGSVFAVCDGRGPIEIHSGSRSFAALQARLGDRAHRVAFAMNAGMFDDSAKPIG